MRFSAILITITVGVICYSCGDSAQKSETRTAMNEQDFKQGTFGYDLNFLKNETLLWLFWLRAKARSSFPHITRPRFLPLLQREGKARVLGG